MAVNREKLVREDFVTSMGTQWRRLRRLRNLTQQFGNWRLSCKPARQRFYKHAVFGFCDSVDFTGIFQPANGPEQ